VPASTLSGKARARALAVLAEHVAHPGDWIDRARSASEADSFPICSVAAEEYFDLNLPESAAEALLRQIEEHRTDMAAGLGRDPGLVVAGSDYLTGVSRQRRLLVLAERGTLASRRPAGDFGVSGPADFRAALDREIERRRRRPTPFSVLRLSMDVLGAARELWGPLLADLAYGRAVEVVGGAFRDTDLASRDDAEGFSVLLPHTDRLAAHEAADRVRCRVAEAFRSAPVAGRDLTMTVSGGIAVYPEDGGVAADVVRRAEEALDASRRVGGDRIRAGHADRRRDVRRAVRGGWSALVAGAREEIGVRGEPIDLSRGGILVTTSERFRPVERVRVFLESPGGETPSEGGLREVVGTVARIAAAPVGEGGWRVGISFDGPLATDSVRPRVRPWSSAAAMGSAP
jgi:diguanylate cyclase (GGDEF)-like protein